MWEIVKVENGITYRVHTGTNARSIKYEQSERDSPEVIAAKAWMDAGTLDPNTNRWTYPGDSSSSGSSPNKPSGSGGSSINYGNDGSMLSYPSLLNARNEQYDWTMGKFPNVIGEATDTALNSAKSIDAYLKNRFYGDLENVLPEWRSDIIDRQKTQLDTVTDLTASQLKGEIPADVQAEIMRVRAELGQSKGLFGDVASMATARDLGRTSYDIMQHGISNAVNAVTPLTKSLLDSTRLLMPPTSDVQSLVDRNSSLLAGKSLPSTSEAMSANYNVQKANADMAWAQELSDIMIAQQEKAWEIEASEAEKDRHNNTVNSMIQGLSNIFGGLFGGGKTSTSPSISSGGTTSTSPSTPSGGGSVSTPNYYDPPTTFSPTYEPTGSSSYQAPLYQSPSDTAEAADPWNDEIDFIVGEDPSYNDLNYNDYNY